MVQLCDGKERMLWGAQRGKVLKMNQVRLTVLFGDNSQGGGFGTTAQLKEQPRLTRSDQYLSTWPKAYS